MRQLSLPELASMPQVESTSVLECAGNGGRGVRLRRGGVGVITWRGVPAGRLLEQTAVLDGGRFVTATAHDTVAVKSVVCRPAQHEVTSGDAVEVSGLAWTGQGRITYVEARVDSGPWLPTALHDSTADWSALNA